MTRATAVGVLSAWLLATAGAAQASTNLIKDGGLEQPAAPSGGFSLFATGQALGPWTVVGASGNVGTVSTTFAQNGLSFVARAGNQWLDLTGGSNSATGVRQVVSTTPGGAYTLTFWVGNVVDPNGIFGTTSTVHVMVDGALLMTAVNRAGTGSTKQVWKKFSATVTASGSRTKIAFINGDGPNDTSCGLDAVSLVPQALSAGGYLP